MIVTTSRYASSRVRKEAIEFANNKKALYIARGKRTINSIVDLAWRKGHHLIIIFREKNGKVAGFDEIEIDQWGDWKWKK
ncbi:MAG: hypothetical protein QXF35_03650 [Candidatus Bilamarchaeaceae archaeon]